MTHQPQLMELPDWQTIPVGTIDLTVEQIDRALQLSRTIPNLEAQWQTYVNVLALQGFQDWIETWAPDLSLNETNCALERPEYASLIDAVSPLHIGQFKVGLIAINSLADTSVAIPKAIIDLPAFTPHFYVLVQVIEEDMLVQICGYLRYDQLHDELIERRSPATSNWTVSVPLSRFSLDPNGLLLQLRCLDVNAMPLPSTVPQFARSSAAMAQRLEALAPQLQPSCFLDRLFSWEEAAVILMQPQLSDRLYQIQQLALQPPRPSVLQTLTQRAMNTGLWLRDQLDAVAQELSWVLLPTLTPATSAMRSTTDQVEAIAAALQQLGMVIPPEARIAYRDLPSENTVLRLYVAIWALDTSVEAPEWALLLVLGTPAGQPIAAGTRFQISDQSEVIVEQEATGEQPFLYTQVEGSWDEQFEVAIEQNTQIAAHFTFAFHPDLQ